MKILLLQLRRLGDVILTTPAIETIRAQFPLAQIALAVARECEPLLPAIRNVDRFLITKRGLRDLAAWLDVRRGCFDATVDFTRNDRSAWLTFLSGAPQRITSVELPAGIRRRVYTAFAPGPLMDLHTIDFNLAQLGPLGIAPAFTAPILALPTGAEQDASAIIEDKLTGKAFAIFHPGSARTEKFWEPERWAEVIEFGARELGLRAVLTGGNSALEQDHLARIRECLRQEVVDLSGRIHLLTLAALITRARLLVTVDSAPMHLAAALGSPQVVLFGPTNPFHWRPRRSPAAILFGKSRAPLATFDSRAPQLAMSLISTPVVIDAMRSMLEQPAAFTPPAPKSDG